MPDPFLLSQAERYAAWLAALADQGNGMLLAAFVGLFFSLWAVTIYRLFPAWRRWLPWAGVGGFYATLASLWVAVSRGLIG